MKTFSAKPGEIERNWYVVDLAGKTLGRAATTIATVLRGKHKASYTPHVDTGDFVIVINAEKVRVTGKKLLQKTYFRYSGYMGGATIVTLEKLLKSDPARVIKSAVWGMLPKGILGRRQFKKLKVYAGAEHPHTAQTPKALDLPE